LRWSVLIKQHRPEDHDETEKGIGGAGFRYAAKVAECELALRREIAEARDAEKAEMLRDQLVQERKKLQAELRRKRNGCGVG